MSAVLWDMDGTLADTETYWFTAYREVVAEHGTGWRIEHIRGLAGRNVYAAAEYLQIYAGVGLHTADLVEQLTARVVQLEHQQLAWRPGAISLLNDLRANNVPCALVTGSPERCAEPVLRALPTDTFTVVVTADSESPGKPHPGPYLRAGQLLGVELDQTLAVEDSETGARSAETAGCTVLLVPQYGPAVPGDHRIIRSTLVGLTYEGLLLLRP